MMRLQKRFDEALAMQLAIEKDAAEANAPDGYVFEEIAEIYGTAKMSASMQNRTSRKQQKILAARTHGLSRTKRRDRLARIVADGEVGVGLVMMWFPTIRLKRLLHSG